MAKEEDGGGLSIMVAEVIETLDSNWIEKPLALISTIRQSRSLPQSYREPACSLSSTQAGRAVPVSLVWSIGLLKLTFHTYYFSSNVDSVTAKGNDGTLHVPLTRI